VVQTIVSGDLVFVRLLGQEIVVINSQRVAEALLDKRSRIYSDRPYIATLEPYVLLTFLHLIIMEYRQVWLVGQLFTHRLW
jgi:hypothetical protein